MSAIERIVENLEIPAAPQDRTPNVYLYPGQIFISGEEILVSTILGSCVAVCLWDPEAEIGGINHFLLPLNPLRGGSDARYGNTAMPRLLQAMVDRGASARRLVAKIVGGASVIRGLSVSHRSIGEQNVIVAREFLRGLDIVVAGDQTGGARGRKLLFETGTGKAYVKEI